MLSVLLNSYKIKREEHYLEYRQDNQLRWEKSRLRIKMLKIITNVKNIILTGESSPRVPPVDKEFPYLKKPGWSEWCRYPSIFWGAFLWMSHRRDKNPGG